MVYSFAECCFTGGEGGIRTPDRSVSPYNGLANRRLQPLGHLSGGICGFGYCISERAFAGALRISLHFGGTTAEAISLINPYHGPKGPFFHQSPRLNRGK